MADQWPFPIGPGGVTGDGVERQQTPEQTASHAAEQEMYSSWGRGAGELARRSERLRRRPILATPEPEPFAFPIGPGGVVDVDRTARAAEEVGVPEAYLRALTGHESGDNPEAQAPTSSATGLGQFTEGTWLQTMRRHGERYGLNSTQALSDLSDADLLDLRSDPMWSLLMTGELARDLERELRTGLGRPVRQNEIYIGHFLGTADAVSLIRAAEGASRPFGRSGRAAAAVSPEAVRDNPQVFIDGGNYERRVHPRTGRSYQHYLGGGRERTASEVLARQSRAFRSDLFNAGERASEIRDREERVRQAEEDRREAAVARSASQAQQRAQSRWERGLQTAADEFSQVMRLFDR